MPDDPETIIVNALDRYGIPPRASRYLIEQARERAQLGTSPEDWVRLVEGPLLEELRDIIPVFNMSGDYAKARDRLLELARKARVEESIKRSVSGVRVRRRIDPEDPETREQVAAELAREEGALAVIWAWPGGAETRGASEQFARLLFASHVLLRRRGDYRVAYLMVKGARVLMRPLGEHVLALVAKPTANLGKLLSKLLEVGVKEVEE